jgi:hypothetical protein
MAIVDATASTADIDSIAPMTHPAKSPTPVSHIDEQQSRTVEILHLDEGDVNVRTKVRTLAIVSALYFVLFIAALDQTIIA